MRSIPSLADHTLTVERPQWQKLRYEIRFGDETVGSLAFPKALSRTCELACAEGTWKIEPAGALKNDFVISAIPGESRTAIYHPRIWSGRNELRFPDGRIFIIKCNASHSRVCAYASDGPELLRFETSGFFHREHKLMMNRIHAHAREYSLILLVTLYVLVSPAKESS